jgi:hypothetical protein
MTEQTPPDWVLREAAKRCGWFEGLELTYIQHYYTKDRTYGALCDMILKHEEPPVDRKMLCAREAVTSADMSELDWDEITVSAACLRAIHLYEGGFGQ